MIKNMYVAVLLMLSVAAYGQGSDTTEVKKNMKVKIQTTLGDIVVRLYDETPVHRDNFVKLVREGYYDGTLFHRVIRDFMIQGGDPDSKGAPADKMLGMGGPDYTLEAEMKDGLIHKRGALAAARQGDQVNPERRSSASQFYIVWGRIYNDDQLYQISYKMKMQRAQEILQQLKAEHRDELMQLRRDGDRDTLMQLQDRLQDEAESKAEVDGGLTEQQQQVYSTIGGTPHLDGQYTVFGEVVEGLDVVDMIQRSATGRADRPVDDVEVRMVIVE